MSATELSATGDTILADFNRLLETKKQLDELLNVQKKRIEAMMHAYPEGIPLQGAGDAAEFFSRCSTYLPPGDCAVLKDPAVWSMVCDAKDTIHAASRNIHEALGYDSSDLIGAYKGKLWAELPDKQSGGGLSRAGYLIYEVKQKHFHGTHEDAFITSSGRVVSILQHRLDLRLADGGLAGYLYLILNIQENKATDYALAEIMVRIEHDLLQTQFALTPEMRRFLVNDLISTREYIEGVLANAIDGILVTSPAGLIIGSTQSFRRLVGYQERELFNQPISMVSPGIGEHPLAMGGTVTVGERYFADMAEMIDRLFQQGRIYGFRQYFKNRQGALITTEINISLLRNKTGEITGFVRNIHDLSEKMRLQQELEKKEARISLLRKEITEYYGPENIVGKSPAMQTIFRLMTKVADSDSTVLLQGESGTGKELIAHGLYSMSPRSQGPFVVLNCGAIPQNLLESELFGHVKGSFTGAIRDKKGLFEEADGGVIFLDEIGELPLDMQVKLLRVIQEREVRPVGGNRQIKIDVRIIAATHKDLLSEMRQGRFREDLFYRINVLTLKLPPLRERPEDIPLLIDFFMSKHCRGRDIAISREAMKILLGYSYPGNVRELENILERALILCEGGAVQGEDLPPEILEPRVHAANASAAQGPGLRQALSQCTESAEKELILNALKDAGDNRALAAQKLRIGRTSLYRKMKKFGIA